MSTRLKIHPSELREWCYDDIAEVYYYLRLHDLMHPPPGGA